MSGAATGAVRGQGAGRDRVVGEECEECPWSTPVVREPRQAGAPGRGARGAGRGAGDAGGEVGGARGGVGRGGSGGGSAGRAGGGGGRGGRARGPGRTGRLGAQCRSGCAGGSSTRPASPPSVVLATP